jgi:formate-dependent nitrite reductase cytochrome c552 subunit
MEVDMRVWIRAAAVAAAVTLPFVMVACEGEQGPQGVAGESGTANCTAACHTDNFQMQDYIVDVQTEFDVSKHNTGDTYLRRGSSTSPYCSGCHTTEGYQYRVANNGATIALESASRIGCFGCHAPHSNENFNLRKTGATDLFEGGPGAYDKGESNTCAMCHQARTPDPYFDSVDLIDSRYWGPHHGPQSNMLSGNGAQELGGGAYSAGHAHNNILTGCVNCHMATMPEDVLAGGHTYGMHYVYRGSDEINDNGCSPCHDGVDVTDKVETAQGLFEAALKQLGGDMVILGWLETDSMHVEDATAPTDADERGALFNYLLLHDDRSLGVHNPTYLNAVLTRTQSFVTPLLP